MAATENYSNAMHTLVNARFKNWSSTEEMLNHFAWGFRNWIMGEIDDSATMGEILSQLKKIDQRLDRLERTKR